LKIRAERKADEEPFKRQVPPRNARRCGRGDVRIGIKQIPFVCLREWGKLVKGEGGTRLECQGRETMERLSCPIKIKNEKGKKKKGLPRREWDDKRKKTRLSKRGGYRCSAPTICFERK